MTSVRGKTVLITGGASGIGRLMGQRMLQAGAARLLIWDRQAEAMAACVAEFAVPAERVSCYPLDLLDTDQIEAAAAQLVSQGIAVDILINNAGIIVGKNFVDHDRGDIDRTMAVNASAPMHVTRVILPGMLARGHGHIVNISSAASLVANPKMSVYCASKWAVSGWSDSLRLEMERGGGAVKVTTVLPFYIDTGMFAGVRSPFIPILKPERVVERIMAAIRRDRIMLRMPWLIDCVPLLRGLLPMRWFDKVGGEWLGVYHSMDDFKGRL